jgi:OmcA/MtrC family decaheme c-type cytochrome
VPVDREGRLTEGEVSLAFGISWLEQADGQPAQYTSYVTRTQTSPLTGESAVQATTESDGTFEAVDRANGIFRYTFARTLEGVQTGLTHTVLVSGSRTIDGTAHRASTTYDFRPDGAPPTVSREVVSDASCTTCHGELEAHGGRYTRTAQCMTCHTPQTTDPDTGNTLDFRVMVHRIHRGAELPSVEDGTPYSIIGYGQSVQDFSTVEFPQEIARCESCHGGAQGDYWKARTGPAACLSCHDNVSFTEPAEGDDFHVLHSGGAQPEGAPCAVCHPASGSLAGVADVHLLPAFDPDRTRVAIEILDVTGAAPGAAPTVRFQVEVDGQPRDIGAAPLNSLRATFAGPNTDFARYWQVTIQGTGAAGTLAAVDAAQGVFDYTPAAAGVIPADATGSYTVGMEGYVQATGGPRFASVSPMRAFAVTGGEAVPRRAIVDAAKCNNCHYQLAGHGGGRVGAQYCTMCHNPNNANDERISRLEGQDIVAESVDFRVMIHKIHAGEELSQSYILGGNPTPSVSNPLGTPLDFGETRYPRALNDCSGCHMDGTFGLPMDEGLLSSLVQVRTCTEDPLADADSLCAPANWVSAQDIRLPPETSVCTSCHDAPFTLAHAGVMTTDDGVESCATCHGNGRELDVSAVHAR